MSSMNIQNHKKLDIGYWNHQGMDEIKDQASMSNN